MGRRHFLVYFSRISYLSSFRKMQYLFYTSEMQRNRGTFCILDYLVSDILTCESVEKGIICIIWPIKKRKTTAITTKKNSSSRNMSVKLFMSIIYYCTFILFQQYQLQTSIVCLKTFYWTFISKNSEGKTVPHNIKKINSIYFKLWY